MWFPSLLAIMAVLLLACGQSAPAEDAAPHDSLPPVRTYTPISQDTTLQVGSHAVEVRVPTGPVRADLLILPGWNFDRGKWCRESRLCDSALALGYRLILPEMGKSLYAESMYAETTPPLAAAPTRRWLRDTAIATLQNTYGILLPDSNGLVVGLSTGGRGVALMVVDMPAVFRAGAALSGDFDLPSMPAERINIAMYGTLAQHSSRWRGAENPMDRIAELKTPLYLGHGVLDNVVPPSQTQRFADAIRQRQPNLPLLYHPAAGHAHDFRYWDSEVPAVLSFFETHLH